MAEQKAPDQAAYSIKTRRPVPAASLLTDEDKKDAVVAEKEDCTTRRRACKNCVCGRAELEKRLEAEGKLEQLSGNDSGPPAGGCGSCSRGDAFRCAGCPFLGKPAWNKAEDGGKVQLNLTDDL